MLATSLQHGPILVTVFLLFCLTLNWVQCCSEHTNNDTDLHPGSHLHDAHYRRHHSHRMVDQLGPNSQLEPEYEWSINDWWHQNIRDDIHSFRDAINGRSLDQSSEFVDSSDQFILSHTAPELNRSRLSPVRTLSSFPILFNSRYRSLPLRSNSDLADSLLGSDSAPVLTYTEPEGKNSSKHLPLVLLSESKSPILAHGKARPSWSSFIPQSSLQSIKSLFYDYFSTIRNGEHNNFQYITIKRNLRQRFSELGLQTMTQGFYPSQQSGGTRIRGHNIVGVYPGIYRNTTNPDHQGMDSVLVIGAHFDTVKRSPGVEDNGSGSATVMELARLLQQHKCALNTTIIFALFDMEESGLHGSKHFVKNYLFPVEIEKRKNPIKGAIIMDMMLEYDSSVNSQSVTDLNHALPDWDRKMRLNQNRGDFLAVWARRNIDNVLFETLEKNWLNRSKYKLFLLDPPLPKLGSQLTLGLQSHKLRPYRTFLRSDHSSFWYPHSLKEQTIENTILLNDMGPWRRRVSSRYHNSQDNTQLLTRDNLHFLKNSIDSLMKTILAMSDGRCQPSSSSSESN